MDVYALVGPSGTGKSHRALVVANKYNIPLIIDDGLLIRGNKILAGSSAKREPTKIAAVRRAIFIEEDHAREVREVLDQLNDERILVLGTSVNMVERIVKELKLPEIQQMIWIEDIASPEEMGLAQEKRLKEGKHVIPVPTIEIKPRFSGYLMESLELILGIKDQQTRAEKTIVRPRFSYYGKLLIHDQVIFQLIDHVVKQNNNIYRLVHKETNKSEEGLRIAISLDCYYGQPLIKVGEMIQEQIKEVVERVTGLHVLEVNINFVLMRLSQ